MGEPAEDRQHTHALAGTAPACDGMLSFGGAAGESGRGFSGFRAGAGADSRSENCRLRKQGARRSV